MRKLTLTKIDEMELSRIEGMIISCGKQMVCIQNKALTEGSKLKDLPSDPRLIPIRKLLIEMNNASCKILQRSYKETSIS